MLNPALRNYRIPAFADTPRTEVVFADTYDKIGPLGAKSQGECAINAVAPAVANALANATGVRFAHLPFTPDRQHALRIATTHVDDILGEKHFCEIGGPPEENNMGWTTAMFRERGVEPCDIRVCVATGGR